MKKCPFCAEEIQEEAIKCRFCGEFLEEKKEEKKTEEKWYYKNYMIVLGFLCVGPFVLPMVWLNPNYTRVKKIVITVMILIVTYFLGSLVINSVRTIISYYKIIFSGGSCLKL